MPDKVARTNTMASQTTSVGHTDAQQSAVAPESVALPGGFAHSAILRSTDILALQRSIGNSAVQRLLAQRQLKPLLRKPETQEAPVASRETMRPVQRAPRAIQRVGGGTGAGLLGSIPIPELLGGEGKSIREAVFGTEQERRSNTGQSTAQLRQQGVYGNVTDVSVPSTGGNTLRGRYYEPPPQGEGDALPGAGQLVLAFSGSGGSAETYMEPIARKYTGMGSGVLAVNYRGFGQSSARFRAAGKGGTPTESGLYNDAYAIFKYARDTLGFAPGDMLVHGFSLGGPVAASLVKTLAKKGIRVRGLVLHSAMPSAREAAGEEAGDMAGSVTEFAVGKFDTRAKLAKLLTIYPDLPLHFMSGSRANGDQLALTAGLNGRTPLLDDVKGMGGGPDQGGFTDVSEGRGQGDHLAVGQHMDYGPTQTALQDILSGAR